MQGPPKCFSIKSKTKSECNSETTAEKEVFKQLAEGDT